MPRTQIVQSDPEIMGGELVFVGTRVPVYNLFDYLAAGDTIDGFLTQFPSVSREQTVAALKLAFAAIVIESCRSRRYADRANGRTATRSASAI